MTAGELMAMAEHVPENGWTLPPARWPWQRSLQRRILFTYGAVFLIILALLMAVVGRVVYRAAVDEVAAHFRSRGVSGRQRP